MFKIDLHFGCTFQPIWLWNVTLHRTFASFICPVAPEIQWTSSSLFLVFRHIFVVMPDRVLFDHIHTCMCMHILQGTSAFCNLWHPYLVCVTFLTVNYIGNIRFWNSDIKWLVTCIIQSISPIFALSAAAVAGVLLQSKLAFASNFYALFPQLFSLPCFVKGFWSADL